MLVLSVGQCVCAGGLCWALNVSNIHIHVPFEGYYNSILSIGNIILSMLTFLNLLVLT